MIEAEPLMRRVVDIFVNFPRATGHRHPLLDLTTNNNRGLLLKMGDSPAQAQEKIDRLPRPIKGMKW
jgi:hypothetical protein